MNIYTNNSFEGFYPVPTAAVVVAQNALEAADLLNKELVMVGLKPTATADQFELLKTEHKAVRILSYGNY